MREFTPSKDLVISTRLTPPLINEGAWPSLSSCCDHSFTWEKKLHNYGKCCLVITTPPSSLPENPYLSENARSDSPDKNIYIYMYVFRYSPVINFSSSGHKIYITTCLLSNSVTQRGLHLAWNEVLSCAFVWSAVALSDFAEGCWF